MRYCPERCCQRSHTAVCSTIYALVFPVWLLYYVDCGTAGNELPVQWRSDICFNADGCLRHEQTRSE